MFLVNAKVQQKITLSIYILNWKKKYIYILEFMPIIGKKSLSFYNFNKNILMFNWFNSNLNKEL